MIATNTLVWTDASVKTLAQLSVGDKVVSNAQLKQVRTVERTEVDRTLTIRAAGVQDVCMSLDQQVYSRKPKDVECTWRIAAELDTEDFIWVPRLTATSWNTDYRSVALTRELANVIGWYLAVGNAIPSTGMVYWNFTRAEEEYAAQLMSDLLVVRAFFVTESSHNRIGMPRMQHTGINGILVKFGSKRMSDWLKLNFGNASANKHIPPWVYRTSPKFIDQLLASYSHADGIAGREWLVSTVSIDLAYGLQRLLNKLGKCIRVITKDNTYGYPTLHQWEYVLYYGWHRRQSQKFVGAYKDHFECAIERITPSNKRMEVGTIHTVGSLPYAVPYLVMPT